MVTYGFYDSANHDRKYSAIQFGSIFDGIIRDGIFMSIGTCFRVVPGTGMMVLVGIGRAWFDHTWTLNDAPLPVTIPQSELLLNRIDAVVIDVDQDQSKRKNDIIVVKGTPSSNPQRPTLIKTATRKQYPLAYISVKANVTEIRAADITSMVGTSSSPYVTGILETVNIDALLDQWKDQWQEFFENQTDDMEKTNAFWKREWQIWYEAQTSEIREAYLAWQSEWSLWSSKYKAMMEDTASEWQSLWNAWFYNYTNQNQLMLLHWQEDWDRKIKKWFEDLQVMLDGDVAANLAKRIEQLEQCCDTVHEFMDNLAKDHTIYDVLYDNTYSTYDNVVDSDQNNILDSNSEPIEARNYNSEPILDSYGHEIETRVIFVIKE